MQLAVVGELLLGEFQLLAACLDGQAEGGLEGRGGGHDASLSEPQPIVYDIGVDMVADIPLRFQQYDI
jgi:hypothetical protein